MTEKQDAGWVLLEGIPNTWHLADGWEMSETLHRAGTGSAEAYCAFAVAYDPTRVDVFYFQFSRPEANHYQDPEWLHVATEGWEEVWKDVNEGLYVRSL